MNVLESTDVRTETGELLTSKHADHSNEADQLSDHFLSHLPSRLSSACPLSVWSYPD